MGVAEPHHGRELERYVEGLDFHLLDLHDLLPRDVVGHDVELDVVPELSHALGVLLRKVEPLEREVLDPQGSEPEVVKKEIDYLHGFIHQRTAWKARRNALGTRRTDHLISARYRMPSPHVSKTNVRKNLSETTSEPAR